MTPDELVSAACPKIAGLGGAFYFNPATVAVGKERGLDGFRFYFLGRGGVLGDVEATVVQSAFGYFHPAMVAKMWNSAKEKLAPREAGRIYMDCCADFGRSRFAGIADLDAFVAAAEAVVEAAEPAGLALFAGISAEPRVDDAPGKAMQLVSILRELRGSAHLAAVIASGLTPELAHAIKRPDDVKTFGYADAPAITDADRAKLDAAEQMTDAIVRPAYSVVDAAGADTMVRVLEAMEAAVAA